MRAIQIMFLVVLLVSPIAIQAQDEVQINSNELDYFNIAAEVHSPDTGSRDIIVMGAIVDINNPVTQDVLSLSRSLIIQNTVGGDIRAIAEKIVIDSTVNGNVALIGKFVEITPTAQIQGSLWIRAEKVILNGEVLGDANISSVSFEQEGTIAGDLTHEEVEKPEQTATGVLWFFKLISLFGMLVVGLVLVSVWPKTIRRATTLSIKNPGKDILWGLAVLVITPIAIIVLMFTVIGIPLAVILGAGLFISLYLAKIFVGIILGTYLFGALRGRDKANKYSLLATMVLGVFVLWLIGGIPGIGWLLQLISMLWGLGLLVNLKLRSINNIESK